MGPMHFFSENISIFPFIIIFLFVAMFFVRTIIFKRGGFRSGWRGRRRHMFDEDFNNEQKSQGTASSTRQESASHAAAVKENRVRPAMQTHLDKAQSYQKQINNLVKSSEGQYRPRMQELVADVDKWIQAIEDLTKQVDNLQRNTLIHQDLKSVPLAIEKLETRLVDESNQRTRRELEQTLDSRKKQLAALQQLQNTINQAELKIENTLSSLGTIYSQLLTTQSTDQVADYGRLSAEVDEEVRTLQDYLDALKEVKLGDESF